MVCTSQLTKLSSSLVMSLAQILNWTLLILQIIYNTQIQEPVTNCLKGSRLSNKSYHSQICSRSTNVILQTFSFTKHFRHLLILFILLLQQLNTAHLAWISEIKWITHLKEKNFGGYGRFAKNPPKSAKIFSLKVA